MNRIEFQRQDAKTRRSAGFPTCCIADFQIGSACSVGRRAGLETRDTADLEVCATTVALHRRPIRTTPLPVLRSRAQLGCHGIVPDVASNSRLLVIVPNPMVVGFRLPKRFVAHADDFLGPTRTELLPRFQDVTQQVIWHRPNDGVRVIGHHNPFVQQIPALVKVPHRAGNKIGNIRPAQMTSSRTTIKIALNFALKVTRDFFLGIVNGFAPFGEVVQPAQSPGLLSFKLHQHFLGQRVRQAESDEIRSTLLFHMRKVAACVNARALRIYGPFLRSAGPQLMARPLQAGVRFIRFVRLHSRSLAECVEKGERGERFVAQVFQPAVSPISKSAGRWSFLSASGWRASRGFGNPRHGRLGSLRYRLGVSAPLCLCVK
jgi:hypothetical protein